MPLLLASFLKYFYWKYAFTESEGQICTEKVYAYSDQFEFLAPNQMLFYCNILQNPCIILVILGSVNIYILRILEYNKGINF